MTDTAANPFLREIPAGYAGGRPEIILDVTAFAEALAPLLGGTLERQDEDSGPRYRWAVIALPDGLRINVNKAWNERTRVTLSSTVDEARKAHNHHRATFPEIKVDTGRPLDKLAKDVTRRLIEPSAEPARIVREAAAKLVNGNAKVRAAAAALMARYPGLRVTVESDTATEAKVYLNQDGAYLSGSLDEDGALYIERVSVPRNSAMTERILDLLTGRS